MPGLIRGVARTAVVAGTATAVSNRVSRRQAERWSEQDAQAYQQQAYQQQPVYQEPPPAAQPVMVVQAAPAPPAEPDMDAKLAQLQQLAQLQAQGILTPEEFEAQKKKILGS